MKQTDWERLSAILFVVLVGIVAIYVFFRFLFILLFPFLLAWLIVIGIRPLSKRIAKCLRFSERVCCVLLFVSLLLLGVWALWWGLLRLLQELSGFLALLLDTGVFLNMWEDLQEFGESLLERLGIPVQALPSLRELVGGLLSTVSASIPGSVAALVSFLPTAFFVVIVTILSGFYFCVDGERIGAALRALLPTSVQTRLRTVGGVLTDVFRRCCKTYLYLTFLIFLILLIGFTVLRLEYAFLASFFLALADLLPIIGVGTVMIPWGILLLLQKNFYLGFGILILYCCVSVMRQIMEPRLLGKSLGVHPLLSLFGTYVGFCRFGVIGMIVSPLFIIALKAIAERRIKKEQ